MHAVLHLHFHFEYFMSSGQIAAIFGFSVPNLKSKGLFSAFERIVIFISSFIMGEFDLIPPDIGLVLVPEIVLELDPDQHNQVPLIHDRVVVKIHPLNYLIFLVVFLHYNLYFGLLFKSYFPVLIDDFHQTQFHIEVHDSKTTQTWIISHLVGAVSVGCLLALSLNRVARYCKITSILPPRNFIWVIA